MLQTLATGIGYFCNNPECKPDGLFNTATPDWPTVPTWAPLPLPHHWGVLFDGYKRESIAYYKALLAIRDMASYAEPRDDVIATIYDIAQLALETAGGMDEEN